MYSFHNSTPLDHPPLSLCLPLYTYISMVQAPNPPLPPQWSWPKKSMGDNMKGTPPFLPCREGVVGWLGAWTMMIDDGGCWMMEWWMMSGWLMDDGGCWMIVVVVVVVVLEVCICMYVYVYVNVNVYACVYVYVYVVLVKGSLDEKLPIYERDPKSKRIVSFDNRFVRD